MTPGSPISMAPGELTELGLVHRLCRAAGVLDIGTFYALPLPQQALWLDFERQDYETPPWVRVAAQKRGSAGQAPSRHAAILAQIERERSGGGD